MEFGLGKNSVLLLRLWGTLAALPACFLCGILLAAFRTAGIVFCIICIAIYLLYFFWYVPRLFRASSVTLLDGRLTWKTGVITSVCTTLRVETILTMAVSHTPLQKLLGLCTLSVRPVGAPILLFHLQESDARQLLRRIEGGADD